MTRSRASDRIGDEADRVIDERRSVGKLAWTEADPEEALLATVRPTSPRKTAGWPIERAGRSRSGSLLDRRAPRWTLPDEYGGKPALVRCWSSDMPNWPRGA